MKGDSSTGIICPKCKTAESDAIDSRPVKGGRWMRRRRWCASHSCGLRWTTLEREAPDPAFSFHPRTNTIDSTTGALAIDAGDTSKSVIRTQDTVSPRSLSDLIRSPSDLLPGLGADPDPSVGSDRKSDRARAKAPHSADFLAFWKAYPRKKSKGKAWRMWQSQQPDINAVLAALSWQTKSFDWIKELGKFIPHPATYLHDSGWEDEPTVSISPSNTRNFDIAQQAIEAHRKANGQG